MISKLTGIKLYGSIRTRKVSSQSIHSDSRFLDGMHGDASVEDVESLAYGDDGAGLGSGGGAGGTGGAGGLGASGGTGGGGAGGGGTGGDTAEKTEDQQEAEDEKMFSHMPWMKVLYWA